MNLVDLKSQARRLQAFLQSKPTHAQALAQGKQSACLEAIAAVHGARSWNVLQASCTPDDSVPTAEPIRPLTPKILFDTGAPDKLGLVFGGIQPGQVHYHVDAGDKVQSTIRELALAVPEGYRVTVLHQGGRAYHHLALCFAGVSTTPARQHEAGGALLVAPAVARDRKDLDALRETLPPTMEEVNCGLGPAITRH